MPVKIFKRYENKYLLNEWQLGKLLRAASERMEPDKYCLDGKKYTIYTIYYDTDNNDIIRHSLSKPYYKEKLRLRSYRPFSDDNDEVFLELKKKIGGIVSKRRAAIKLAEAIRFIETGEKPQCKSYLDQQVIEEISFFLKSNSVSPKVLLCYDRQAFWGTEDKELRLTVDSNLRTRRKSLFIVAAHMNRKLIENGKYLVEIKMPGSMPLWLAQALSDIGAASMGFSKYGAEYKQFIADKNQKKSDGRFGKYIPQALPLALCMNNE